MCHPPRIYPPPLPEYTPLFSTTICEPPRIYLSLPEYTPLFNNYIRPSQNLPRINPPFQQIYMCQPPRIFPPSQNIPPFSTTIRRSQNSPRYTPLFNKIICAILPEYSILPRIYHLFLKLYASPSEATPPAQNIPISSTTICDYLTLPEYTPPPFQQLHVCATLPECTPPSRNIPFPLF